MNANTNKTYLFDCREVDDYLKVSIEPYSGPSAHYNDYSGIILSILSSLLDPNSNVEDAVFFTCQEICSYGVSSIEEANDIRAGVVGFLCRYTAPLLQTLPTYHRCSIEIDSDRSIKVVVIPISNVRPEEEEYRASLERGDWIPPSQRAFYGT